MNWTNKSINNELKKSIKKLAEQIHQSIINEWIKPNR